jgi:hypothetical protein
MNPLIIPAHEAEQIRNATLIGAAEIVCDALSADKSKMRITHVITTGMLNRNGHRVVQAGGDMSEYRQSPIVLFNHNSDMPAVAKSIGQEHDARRDRWVAETEFAPTQFGHELWTLYSGDYMKAWSIGFHPIADAISYEKNDKGDILAIVFGKWKLFEYSPVPIPANPDAVNQALRHKLISESTYRLLNYADELATDNAGPAEQAPPSSSVLDRLVSMRLRVRGAADRKLEG